MADVVAGPKNIKATWGLVSLALPLMMKYEAIQLYPKYKPKKHFSFHITVWNFSYYECELNQIINKTYPIGHWVLHYPSR